MTDIWSDDLLDRRSDARLLIDFLTQRNAERAESGRGSYVLNLNAGWGHGKTFFMERLARQLALEGYLACYVNAWRDDAGDEPLVAVLSAIENTLKPHLKSQSTARKLWDVAKISTGEILAAAAKGAAKRAASKLIGDSIEEIASIVARTPDSSSDDASKAVGSDPIQGDVSNEIGSIAEKLISTRIKSYEARIRSTDEFKRRMSSLLAHLSERDLSKIPMFILLDELDRCRPTYAIETLEQIKHLFDVKNIVFLISTDRSQLAHAITAVYGSGFDGNSYLNRFFDRQYHFDEPARKPFSEYLFKSAAVDQSKFYTPDEIALPHAFAHFAASQRMKLRDMEQMFDIVRSFSTVWDYSFRIQAVYLFPLAYLFQKGDIQGFEALASGKTAAFSDAIPGDWSTSRRVRSREHGAYNQVTKYENLVALVCQAFSKGLPALAEQNVDGTTEFGILRQFSDELQKSFPQGYRYDQSPQSVVREYGNLIRSLGRFSRSTDDQ